METKRQYMDRMEDKQVIYLDIPPVIGTAVPVKQSPKEPGLTIEEIRAENKRIAQWLRMSYCWMYFWNMAKVKMEIK